MAAVLLAAGAAPLAAQTLTLGEALRRADAGAFANRMAAATARAADAAPGLAARGIRPTLRFEGAWMRTNDPIGAFGTQLRQRSVTPAAFDPARLNDPLPIGDVATAAIIEVPVANADAWLGRLAARRGSEASRAQARWTRTRTQLDVVAAYYGAQLAAERVTTLEAASRAAHDHVRAAVALAAGGLATRSDALLAGVKAGEIDADLASARTDAALARAALAVVLGAPDDTGFVLPATLPASDRVRALAETSTADTAPRADVEAAHFAAAAARADRARARAMILPRLNAFARYDWHAPTAFAGGTPMWTLGVMAAWTPFAGGAEIAERRGAAARLDLAEAGEAATAAAARLETLKSDGDLATASVRLAIADSAVTQSAEAHRLVARRYDGGLASVTELLDAAAADTGTRLRQAAARYDLILALARRNQARGLALTDLQRLDRE